MGILKRAWDVTEAKINALLDKLEDPNETIDLSYEKMLDGLQQVKTHLADVMTEQKRLENKISAEKEKVAQREEEAKSALKLNKDDLAREALHLKQETLSTIADLQKSLITMTQSVASLKAAEQKFQQRVARFRDKKDVVKAAYTGAQSQARVSESLGGLSGDMGGVGRALNQAKDKIETMQARSQAVNALMDDGSLKDPLDDSDSMTNQLDDVRHQSAVEDELEKLKKDLQG